MVKVKMNLVPDTENTTPDYYCTWQTQLYATSGGSPKEQRDVIGEKQLFGKEYPYGWAYLHERARRDLLLVMDDSWDVPIQNEEAYFGSLELDKSKFPESTKKAATNAEALKLLTDRIKALGWKGLGGWVCAQKAPKYADVDDKEYWISRLEDANAADFSYWKVDWGAESTDIEFRKMLTELGWKHAPRLTIEHGVTRKALQVSDVYRTYDVPAIMSIPMTVEKIADIACREKPREGYRGIVNCEDEAYIAAAGGFSMGIMRHSYVDSFPNGEADRSFPSCHRDLKRRMYEIVRAARWHRIAPAFSFSTGEICISEQLLTDTWNFENRYAEIEQWWFKTDVINNCIFDGVLTKTAPAAISRNCELPRIEPDEDGNIPYAIASKNPNGVFSIATLGRTVGRRYYIPRCSVVFNIGDADTVGIFGEYRELILETDKAKIDRVYLQDLSADTAYDVSDDVMFADGRLTVSGELLKRICIQPKDDVSDCGAVLKIF